METLLLPESEPESAAVNKCCQLHLPTGSCLSGSTLVVLCLISAAAVFSVHVGFKVLGAASQVQDALGKLHTILTLLYAFACENQNIDILSPEDCQMLCSVIDC